MPEVPMLFEGRSIRKVWFEDEWWFAVVDVVAVLTESANPQGYWRRLKQRLKEEGASIIKNLRALKVQASDGKYYAIDSARLYDIIDIARLLFSVGRRERQNLPEEAGVYAIENTLTGERYIGSSLNIPQRWLQHRADLQKGSHSSSFLQEAWNRDGADAFTWIVLEYTKDIAELESIEQCYIDSWQPAYNRRSEAINMLSLKPVDSDKMHKFTAFLLESAYSLDNPIIKALIRGIRYGLIFPGPKFQLFSQIANGTIGTWEDLESFLQQSEVI